MALPVVLLQLEHVEGVEAALLTGEGARYVVRGHVAVKLARGHLAPAHVALPDGFAPNRSPEQNKSTIKYKKVGLACETVISL